MSEEEICFLCKQDKEEPYLEEYDINIDGKIKLHKLCKDCIKNIIKEKQGQKTDRSLAVVLNPLTLEEMMVIDKDVFPLAETEKITKDMNICYMSYIRGVNGHLTDILLFWDSVWTILTTRPKLYTKDKLRYNIKECLTERRLVKQFNKICKTIPLLVTWEGLRFRKYLSSENKKKGFIGLKEFFESSIIQNMVFGHEYIEATLIDIYSMFFPGKDIIQTYFKMITSAQKESLLAKVSEVNLLCQIFECKNRLILELMCYIQDLTGVSLKYIAIPRVWKWMDSWIKQEHKRRNWIFPNQLQLQTYKGGYTRTRSKSGGKYAGGNVIHPKRGLHFNVVEIDFTSMYPNILIKMNLSYETYNCPHQDCKKNRIDKNSWVCLKRKGLYPSLIEPLLKKRVELGKEDIEDRLMGNLLKTITTIFCGYLVSNAYELALVPLAELLPLMGQTYQNVAKEFIGMIGKVILYGDTDSLYVKGVNDEELSAILKVLDEYIRIPMHVERYRFIKFIKRKTYFGVTDQDVLRVKGLRGISKSAPKIIRDSLKEEVEKFKQIQDKNEFKTVIQEIKNRGIKLQRQVRSKKVPVEQLVERVELSKKLEYYTGWSLAVQLGIQLINSRRKDWDDLTRWTKLRFLKLKNEKWIKVPSELHHLCKNGERKRVTKVIPVEIYDGEDLDWGYYEDQIEKMFSEICI